MWGKQEEDERDGASGGGRHEEWSGGMECVSREREESREGGLVSALNSAKERGITRFMGED
jgi:hypothetical protein